MSAKAYDIYFVEKLYIFINLLLLSDKSVEIAFDGNLS